MSSSCPECSAEVDVDQPAAVSQLVVCPECSADLEVVAVTPLALALAPEVEEDWGE